jgi:hypothetical protein
VDLEKRVGWRVSSRRKGRLFLSQGFVPKDSTALREKFEWRLRGARRHRKVGEFSKQFSTQSRWYDDFCWIWKVTLSDWAIISCVKISCRNIDADGKGHFLNDHGSALPLPISRGVPTERRDYPRFRAQGLTALEKWSATVILCSEVGFSRVSVDESRFHVSSRVWIRCGSSRAPNCRQGWNCRPIPNLTLERYGRNSK